VCSVCVRVEECLEERECIGGDAGGWRRAKKKGKGDGELGG